MLRHQMRHGRATVWFCLALSTLLSCRPAPTTQTGLEIEQMQLTTYLLFEGRCKEAMTFYQGIFGGELTITTVGDSPMKGAFPAAMHGRIVSARLKSPVVDISASDWLRPTVAPVHGNMVMLYLSGGTPEATRAIFTKLSEGAEVTDPISEQPFGLYGALNDKFGNRWMFHADAPPPQGG